MRKLLLLPLLLVASIALAQNVHFVKGPTLVDAGTTLVLSGKLAGLGEGDITILLAAAGVASVECTNPGGNIAPGQDTEFVANGSGTFPAAKNGTLTFSLSTIEPNIPSSACPNNQWTAEATDVAFTGGTIVVVQGGQIVLSQEF